MCDATIGYSLVNDRNITKTKDKETNPTPHNLTTGIELNYSFIKLNYILHRESYRRKRIEFLK